MSVLFSFFPSTLYTCKITSNLYQAKGTFIRSLYQVLATCSSRLAVNMVSGKPFRMKKKFVNLPLVNSRQMSEIAAKTYELFI